MARGAVDRHQHRRRGLLQRPHAAIAFLAQSGRRCLSRRRTSTGGRRAPPVRDAATPVESGLPEAQPETFMRWWRAGAPREVIVLVFVHDGSPSPHLPERVARIADECRLLGMALVYVEGVSH